MPKITSGGVSNQIVDPDFIAEPGIPVEKAMDEGFNDVGREGVHIGDDRVDGQDKDRDRKAVGEQPKGNDDEQNGRKQTPAKKTAPAAKK